MMTSTESVEREYFRRDQRNGVSAPDLSKLCTYAEHIVHARGKRTQYTSVSLDLTRIRDFGDTDYRLERVKAAADGHILIEHETLIAELRTAAIEGEKGERLRAVQALRYATKRKEGLVKWQFRIEGIVRKELIGWAEAHIQAYFIRV
jgi:hypothetical protein